jgi:predicted transcriptional regulator
MADCQIGLMKFLGRKPKLTPKQVAHARKLLEDRNITIKDVAASLGVNRATIYRSITVDPRPTAALRDKTNRQ